MLFESIGLIDDHFEYRPDCYLAVEGSFITHLGSERPVGDFGEIYDGRGKILMPGLFNAHSHAPMTLLRGYAENLPLDRWLNEKVFPFEDLITDADAYDATLLAIAEMLRFGVVSFSDMYFFNDARAYAVLDSGVKANLCPTVTDFVGQRYEDTANAAIFEDYFHRFHGAGDGRLLIDMGLHAEYTSTPAMVESFGKAVKQLGARLHIHLSETKNEVEECKERHGGMTPPAYFEHLGLFDNPTLAAHGVWLEPEDFEILARHELTVASCPASNAKLGSGIADIKTMRAAGIPLALGTDGAASNNNLNMFKDLYLLALMGRAKNCDPVDLTAPEALRCACLEGARAQGRTDCGVIAEGMRADLTVLEATVPWMTPADDYVNHLVFAAQGSDVCLTMVDGRVLYRNGQWPTIDVERVMASVTRSRRRILAEL